MRKGIDDLKHHRRPRYLTDINGEADPLKAKDKKSKEFTRDLIISQLYGRQSELEKSRQESTSRIRQLAKLTAGEKEKWQDMNARMR